jgi:DNA invertase Pin-like site-specific DNA recombinase
MTAGFGGVFAQGGVRVGLYARVSTHDQQTLPLQILSVMREYAARREWSIVQQVEDIGYGASSVRPSVRSFFARRGIGRST